MTKVTMVWELLWELWENIVKIMGKFNEKNQTNIPKLMMKKQKGNK